MTTSAMWRIHFSRRWPLELELNHTGQWPLAEQELLADSLRQFQLGEGSDGCNLLRFAREFGAKVNDADLPEAVAGLIAEEQRHSRWLGEVLRHQDVQLMRKHWVDGMFRLVRRAMGFGFEIAVLVCAEIIAVPYYAAVRKATSLPALRVICDRILEDEAFHLQFQSANLALVGHRCPAAHRALQSVVCLVVWQQHGAVLRKGGYTFRAFHSECERLLFEVQERSRASRLACASA